MNDRITTLILAGGRSSRMGQDKAGLLLGEKSVLEHILENALKVSGHVVVMRAPDQPPLSIQSDLSDRIKIGFDRVEGEGPLQGIADSLIHLPAQAERVFVLTCDLPFLSNRWIEALNEAFTEDWDAVCTHSENITNALLALYRPQVLHRAQELLNEGKRRPLELLKGWRVKKLEPTHDLPLEVKDMNTPSEYENAKLQFEPKT